MNGAQLSAWAQQNKTALLAAGAAGAVGLGLLHRKKGGAASGPAGSLPADRSTASAGGQTAGASGAYDSSASDVASWLSPQLETIIGRLPGSSGTPPVPVAAQGKVAGTLLSPSGSGKYLRDKLGRIAEVESDGSLLALTNAQWNSLLSKLGKGNVSVTQLRGQIGAGAGLPVYDVEHNLRRLNAPPVATPAPTPTTTTPPTPVTAPPAA